MSGEKRRNLTEINAVCVPTVSLHGTLGANCLRRLHEKEKGSHATVWRRQRRRVKKKQNNASSNIAIYAPPLGKFPHWHNSSLVTKM